MSNSEILKLLRESTAGVEIGAPPGHMTPIPGAHSTKVKALAFDEMSIDVAEDPTPSQVAELRARHPMIWVRVQGLADVDRIRALVDEFGIHDLAASDVVNLRQRSKLDMFDDHALVVLHPPVPEMSELMETEQLSLVFARDCVLTFEQRMSSLLDPVLERIVKGRGQIRGRAADYLAYAILDTVIDSFYPLVEGYGDILEVIEARAMLQPNRDTQRMLHTLRSDLLLMRRAIWPLREITSTLSHGSVELVETRTQLYLRDCHDHAVHLIETIEILREITFSLVELYMSNVNTRLNDVMRVLTVIATIFMPLSFIASLYGMNFDRTSPYNMPELGWGYGYIFALALMAVTTGAMLWYFRARGWLTKGQSV